MLNFLNTYQICHLGTYEKCITIQPDHKTIYISLKQTMNMLKKCIRYTIPKTVNEAPNCIIDKVDTHSLQGYSKYIKNYIIGSYNMNCNIVNCYICSR